MAGDGHRHWSGHRRWRPFGCLFLLFGLFAAGTMVVGAWAAAAILGLVDAPPIVVGSGLVAFVLVALGAVAVARGFRRLSGPLDELIAASGRIEAGDYSTRVAVDGSGEIRSLARAFNQMSERLEASDERRRAFLADVAHELRTPLTVMQGQLEAIEDGVYEPDGEHIAALLSHTRSMARLVEDLRTISLAEVGALELELGAVDVVALAQEVAAAYRTEAASGEIELRVDGPERCLARADRSALGRVLGNLVSNAIRHTPAGGHVTIRLAPGAHDGGLLIEVSDDGAGMSRELMDHAFERFEKGPGSEGSGLGLAIARDLVEAQGGRIELRSEAGAGTTVRIRLEAGEAST
jgi:two-component system sensor histidine kinase BaeS